MGHTRALTRKGVPPSTVEATFDVFCSSAACLAGVDGMSRTHRSLLPLTTAVLAEGGSEFAPQLCEWMTRLGANERGVSAPETVLEALKASMPAFKWSNCYTEASAWSRMVPSA